MKAPTIQAPFVVFGGDGKEYPAETREMLAAWRAQGSISDVTRVWSTADQRWMTFKEMRIQRTRRVPVTTGDLKEDYRVIDVVFAFVGKDTPALGRIDFPAAYSEATDELANAAAALGASAVVWARFEHEWQGAVGGAGVFASGTAVVFTGPSGASENRG